MNIDYKHAAIFGALGFVLGVVLYPVIPASITDITDGLTGHAPVAASGSN